MDDIFRQDLSAAASQQECAAALSYIKQRRGETRNVNAGKAREYMSIVDPYSQKLAYRASSRTVAKNKKEILTY